MNVMDAGGNKICLFLSAFICVHLRLFSSCFAEEPTPKFHAETIDDKILIGYGVAAADVDGDRKPDILLADKKQFVWYRNPSWEKFIIADDLTKRDNVCLAAEDIDGDGKCELAVGADWDPTDRDNSGAVFYLIAPKDRTQKWEPIALPAEPTVHRMRWMKLTGGGWGLVVAPLHGRGKEGTNGSKIMLYQMPAGPRGKWTTEVLNDSMHATHNFDLTGPSRMLVAGREGLLGLSFVEEGGNRSIGKELRPSPKGAGEVRNATAFIATVEPMHGEQLVIDAEGKRTVVKDNMSEGHALACGKLVAGDQEQVVVGWRGKGGGVRLFSCIDNDLSRWREWTIDDGGMACEDLCLADLNGDGKLDIIASGRASRNVKIYWNETKTE